MPTIQGNSCKTARLADNSSLKYYHHLLDEHTYAVLSALAEKSACLDHYGP